MLQEHGTVLVFFVLGIIYRSFAVSARAVRRLCGPANLKEVRDGMARSGVVVGRIVG